MYLEQDVRFNLQSQSLSLTLQLWLLVGDGVLNVLNLFWLQSQGVTTPHGAAVVGLRLQPLRYFLDLAIATITPYSILTR